ncbi:AFF1 protein, partial [Nothoprocta pentlandii]|nr:AFF1 protein [Nothoprocta pentlandii]
SLYNEERNLLRIRERERRNQEALQERDTFPENAPLFAEPYKTNKEDELSSRIQNMLGNYEEVKELISTKSHQDLIGVPKSVVPLMPQGRPDRPFFHDKTSHTLAPPFQPAARPQPMGPPAVAPPPPSHLVPYQKPQSRAQPAPGLHTKAPSLPGSRSQGPEPGRGGQESHAGPRHKRSDRRGVGEGRSEELQASLSELSPLLSSLSSPVAPLSPLHSSQRINSRPQKSHRSHGPSYSQPKSPQEPGPGAQEGESRDGSAVNLAGPAQPPSQAFPPPLPSKTSAMQQKPTAYVRPMDGQDQAPVESPELKPLAEEFPGEAYEKISELKASAKAKLSKLKIPSEPIEQTFPGDVHCVEEILKEMTHSWPPPLTAIHTPSTAEPCKFPFPSKDSQHVGSVAQNQKQYDAPSKTLPNSQPRTSMLQDDLQLSDSEDSGDDQPSARPPSHFASRWPRRAPPSQPQSVASAHSSSAASGSTSDSDTSSDSETESSSSDSEANDGARPPAPEPDPPTSNKWQLDNWLTKVNPPAVPTESPGELGHGDGHEESKEQGKSISSTCSHERPGPKEPHPKSSSRAGRAPQDAHLASKRSGHKSPARSEEPSQRHTVGIKRPSKVPAHEGPKGGLKVESEPAPYEAQDPSSRDKPKVKTKGRPRSGDKKESKATSQEPSENRKHKGSHQASSKGLLDPKPPRDALAGSAQEHLPVSPLAQSQGTPPRTSGTKAATVGREDFHRDKFPLPVREKTLLSPVRDFPLPHALVVKIELALLSRIPRPPGKGSRQRKAEAKELLGVRRQDLERKSTDPPDKSFKKRKREMEKESDRKKMKTDKETKSLQSSAHKDSSKLKVSKASLDMQRRDVLLPPPLPPPASAPPAPKAPKGAQKRPRSESGEQPAPDSTAKNKSSHKDPLSSKHRKVDKYPEQPKSNKESAGDVTNPFPVPSLPNGTSQPRRPQVKFEKHHSIEYYIEEAKRLKHKADAMTDKVGKAFQYLDAALAFIEYGIAIESDTAAPKSAYSIFADTMDLIKFIMTLKPFMDSSASSQEKIFAVLCMRCQAVLHMAMFRYKKDTAVKYSRILNDHFKSSSRVTQAPSPCVARSSGTPSPLSPMPSPASSGSSQPGSNASSCGGGGSLGSAVSVPSNIPVITSSYVNITSYVLYAYDIWEHADALARRNKDFFDELSTAGCALALNSSLTELVHYTRQGLQWLRLETNTP